MILDSLNLNRNALITKQQIKEKRLASVSRVHVHPNWKLCLASGRVHAFGPDAMVHRVSLEAAGNGSVEAVYTNSWIQPARQRACGPSGGAGDLLTGGLALPRMLVLAAMASLVGVELPTTERTAAGSTSVVNQAMPGRHSTQSTVSYFFLEICGNIGCLATSLPHFAENTLKRPKPANFFFRVENCLLPQSHSCHLRLSCQGRVFNPLDSLQLGGCWSRRWQMLTLAVLWYIQCCQGGTKGRDIFSTSEDWPSHQPALLLLRSQAWSISIKQLNWGFSGLKHCLINRVELAKPWTVKGFFLQKCNPVIQNRNYISQPTLAEGRCLVLLLASFMQMAAQTGGRIAIKSLHFKIDQVLPYASAISTDRILPWYALDQTLGHRCWFLLEKRFVSSTFWQRHHLLQLQLQHEVLGFNKHTQKISTV